MSDSEQIDAARELLRQARLQYIKSWEFLADASNPRDRRNIAREKAVRLADEHAAAMDDLQVVAETLQGEPRRTLHACAEGLEPLIGAWRELPPLSPIAVVQAERLHPKSVGCGSRYRRPQVAGNATRAISNRPPRRERHSENHRGR